MFLIFFNLNTHGLSCVSLIRRLKSPLPPLAPCMFRPPTHTRVFVLTVVVVGSRESQEGGAGPKHNWRLAFGGRRRETGERKEGRHPEVEEVSDDSCIAELHLTKDSFRLHRCSSRSLFLFSAQSTVQVGECSSSVCWMIK